MQYCLNGDYAIAIQPLENSLKIPNLLKHQEARLLMCLGVSYCQEFQCAKAVVTLGKALTYEELSEAGRNTAIYYLATSHFYLRNHAIASELFKYTIANPNIPSEVKQRARTYQGLSYHQMKNYAAAVDSFRAALAMQGSIEVDSLNYNLGISLFGMKNYDEAIDPLFNASQSSTLNARYKSNAKICLAECYLKGSLCR
jgi:tetratricopeptide (TPR) repeat protein